MALKGDLQTLPLRDLLGWLSQRRASGTLSLSRGMIARRFQLRQGRVMLSSSTDEEMLLGRLLVKRGVIDAAQLEDVLKARQGTDTRLRLGAALARAGLVSNAELRSVLTDKVRRLLLDALRWTEGGFFFDDAGPLPRRPAIAAIVRLTEVLAMPVEELDAATVDADDVLVTDDDIIEIIELTTVHRPGADRVRGKRKRSATRPGAPTGSDFN